MHDSVNPNNKADSYSRSVNYYKTRSRNWMAYSSSPEPRQQYITCFAIHCHTSVYNWRQSPKVLSYARLEHDARPHSAQLNSTECNSTVVECWNS